MKDPARVLLQSFQALGLEERVVKVAQIVDAPDGVTLFEQKFGDARADEASGASYQISCQRAWNAILT